MKLLLDTHVLLWWLADSQELATDAHRAIADGRNTVFLSAASIWEMVIKRSLGKLDLPDDFEQVVMAEPMRRLDISIEHALAVAQLADIHRDPFDRILLAQCLVEKLTLVTRDSRLSHYGVDILQA